MDKLHQWLHSAVDKLTIVLAAVFIIFGSGVLVTSLANQVVAVSVTANAVDSVIVSPHYLQEDQEVKATTKLTFDSDIPSTVTDSFTVIAYGQGVRGVRLTIHGITVLNSITLLPESNDTSTYRFLVPIDNLKLGDYHLELSAYNTIGEKIITRGPRVTIKSTDTEIIKPIESTRDQDRIIESAPEETSFVSEEPLTSSLILPTNEIVQDELIITISTSRPVQEVNVYAQSTRGTTPLYLGAARARNSQHWILTIDSTDIPNGLYQLYAQATAQDITVRSSQQLIAINNLLPLNSDESVTVTERPADRSTPSMPTLLTDTDSAVAKVATPPTPPSRTNSPSVIRPQLVTSSELVVRRVLHENQTTINKIISEYVLTTDEPNLSATTSITNITELIVFEILQDRRLRGLSTAAQAIITNEIKQLVQRGVQLQLAIGHVHTTEDGSSESLQSLVDAIEVLQSTITDVTSPREFGLVRNDIFIIDTVVPLVVTDEIASTSRIFAEIKGRAIPNSQITLYIYSSPVMVTITAAADGTFSYVYEKELDDGDHEVYVALTNTNGAVVAKSNGFRFVKEAQAFTPVDDLSGDSLVPLTTSSPAVASAYTTVLAVSIIALGLLLLLLGSRNRRATPQINDPV